MKAGEEASLNQADSHYSHTMWGIAGSVCAQFKACRSAVNQQIIEFPVQKKLITYLQASSDQELFNPRAVLSFAVRLFHEQHAVQKNSLRVITLLSSFELLNPETFTLFVCFQTSERTSLFEFIINESQLSQLLQQLSNQSEDEWGIQPVKRFSCEVSELFQELWLRECEIVWFKGKQLQPYQTTEKTPVGVLSGSFDPLHTGHHTLKQLAEQHLEAQVCFELPVWNADKPPLDYLSLQYRLEQFGEESLILSTASTFLEKARVIGSTTFVVGADTAERIVDCRFYGNSELQTENALEELLERECRFLVAPRQVGNRLMNSEQFVVSNRYSSLFEFWSVEEFLQDISSSELRMRSSSAIDPFAHFR